MRSVRQYERSDADILRQRLPLIQHSVGKQIHNIELRPGRVDRWRARRERRAQWSQGRNTLNGECPRLKFAGPLVCKRPWDRLAISNMKTFYGKRGARDGKGIRPHGRCGDDPSTIPGGGEGKLPAVANPVTPGGTDARL